MEDTILGNCCICEKTGADVRNILMLHKKAMVSGHGWGCFQCGLPSDGAVAVLCDDCFEKFKLDDSLLKWACRGYPASDGRILILEMPDGEFDHDLSRHPEAFIECKNCLSSVNKDEKNCPNCEEQICPMCGCTDSAACEDGCDWTADGICTVCEDEVKAMEMADEYVVW